MSSVTPLLPAALPDLNAARLPGVYETAQRALAECSRIDECKTWADKAAALASYAKQAKDDSLCVMARRIQARAYRRMGELLKQIPTSRGENLPNVERDGTVPTGVVKAAETAGLSERQRKTALRVASVPEPEFKAVTEESASPATVTQLAARGIVPRTIVVPDDIEPAPLPHAQKAQALLRELAGFCATHDPQRIAAAFRALDVDAAQGYVQTVDSWLDRFVTSLPEDTVAF